MSEETGLGRKVFDLICGVAAVLALISAGWGLAVTYDKVYGKLNTVYDAAVANEQAIEIQHLRTKLADSEKAVTT